MDFIRAHILVCTGTGCSSAGAEGIISEFEAQLKKHDLDKEVRVVKTGCLGLCAKGPNVVVYPEGVYYSHVSAEDVPEIVEEHILKGRKVDRLIYSEVDESGKATSLTDTAFYKDQVRIALRNCGIINPEDIDEYIAYDGYAALAKVLTEMTPQQVIDEIKASGLKGRSGAGFPTGMKWQFAANSPGPVKYACCNADEGDPGAFMDRSVLEGDPHSVLEAMTIAGYAIGATEGYIYVRAEYPIAVERLKKALEQSHEYGFLGKNIFGTDFSFDIDIRLGSGAFVCGEETALMVSIEGKRGEPRCRPPYPAVKGLFGKPTILNNVETYANVCWIINHGAEAYAALGTEGSKGTKVFALTGKVQRGGLVEVPMGNSLRDVIFDIAGGIKDGRSYKAVQMGGPSGGCIPADLVDTPIDYKALSATGAIMGSGGLVVMDENTCMVEVARFFMSFTQRESCGKCVPCREGTKRMLEILERIVAGKGELSDLDELEELANMVQSMALCGLGKSAPLPVISTLKRFRDEYVEHIVDKKCRAKVCTALRQFHINPEFCIGCGKCAKNCPAGAISGKIKHPHVINNDVCIKCGSCKDNCNFDAIYVEA